VGQIETDRRQRAQLDDVASEVDLESPYLPHPLCLGGDELAGHHDLCRGRLVRGESEAFGRAMGHVVFVIALGKVRVGSRGLILRRGGGVKVIIVERGREDRDCHYGGLREALGNGRNNLGQCQDQVT